MPVLANEYASAVWGLKNKCKDRHITIIKHTHTLCNTRAQVLNDGLSRRVCTSNVCYLE